MSTLIKTKIKGIIYPDGGQTYHEYNWKHQKISETDRDANRTYYTYDEKNNLTKIEKRIHNLFDNSECDLND